MNAAGALGLGTSDCDVLTTATELLIRVEVGSRPTVSKIHIGKSRVRKVNKDNFEGTNSLKEQQNDQRFLPSLFDTQAQVEDLVQLPLEPLLEAHLEAQVLREGRTLGSRRPESLLSIFHQ